jgi:hypothetical protein
MERMRSSPTAMAVDRPSTRMDPLRMIRLAGVR